MTINLRTGFSAAILTAFTLALAPDAALAAPHPALPGFELPAGGDAQIVKVRRGRGADDGPSHDVNDDKGGRKGGKGRGRDDGPGDDKGGRKGGKGRGTDDAHGDDKGGRKGGKGRGRDDGPNHT
ncbi:hypothetical protein OCH239_03760 [Roseivivax halodurans JCM 10272]|uniref:Uncharacterized protein n=1 Tax=Roseivivax halodurans JCM 10272 TaxID=1449350 RepID=X7EGW3_9RHOB|nr:hypothetical protein [Roseivivax halodurans]ETX14426.1 hypothetical protein OCH239_03760 [Roseivivax halodurans JCM 10272]